MQYIALSRLNDEKLDFSHVEATILENTRHFGIFQAIFLILASLESNWALLVDKTE